MALEFSGPATPLDDAAIASAANKLGCEVAAVRAVVDVESGGGFLPDGRPKILFERHKVYLGWCLPQQTVGLEEVEGDKWIVYFGPHALAVVDAADGKLRPLHTAPSTKTRKKRGDSINEEETNDAR